MYFSEIQLFPCLMHESTERPRSLGLPLSAGFITTMITSHLRHHAEARKSDYSALNNQLYDSSATTLIFQFCRLEILRQIARSSLRDRHIIHLNQFQSTNRILLRAGCILAVTRLLDICYGTPPISESSPLYLSAFIRTNEHKRT